MNKSFVEWLDYYENATKEDVIQDMMFDINSIKEKNKEIERLNNIINEFNKLIENEINESKLEEDYDRVDAMEYCLATLRELKGSDKELVKKNFLIEQ